MAKRVRIFHFLDSLHLGGAERQVLKLVDGLRGTDFEVRVACFRARGELEAEARLDGAPVREFPIASLRNPAALLQLLALARHLRRERIDVVHTTTLYPNIFGVLAARLARTPVIVASVRDMGSIWSGSLRRAQRWACRFADAVVTNAEAIADRLVSEGYERGRIEVIRNGVEPSGLPARSHPEFRRELGIPHDAPVVGAVCRLHWVKALEDLVEAAPRVLAVHPATRFVVIGPDSGSVEREAYADRLRARAAELELGERFLFAGLRNDVPRVLTELTVSVLPSLSEGLSNTLLESMAAGVPVVATAVGGNPEIVADGETGLLVPASRPDELAAAIGRLLDSPSLAAAMGREGRRRIVEQFGCARMVDQTAALYQRLLAREGRRGVGRTLPARLRSTPC